MRSSWSNWVWSVQRRESRTEMLFLYSNLMRWYKKLEPDSPWNCTAMTQATTWENLTGCWEKLCHCQGGNHRSRWCRGTVECLSLEWKPHWTWLWRTCSHQICSCLGGETVPPLEDPDPSHLYASVIPCYSNKYFSSPWSKSKIFLHSRSIFL